MQQATKPHIVTSPGEQQTRIHGRYKVTLSLPVGNGFSIATFAATSPHRYAELCVTTFDVDAANLIYRTIREGGEKGVAPDGVRAAIRDALSRELNNTLNRRGSWVRERANELQRLIDMFTSPEELAELDRLADDIWEHMRRAFCGTPDRTLADTVPAGQQPQVPRSRSGAEFKPLSDAMRRALAASIYGVVYPRNGVARATLRALARRGYGRLHFEGARKRITCLELNERGRAAAEVEMERMATGKAVA